MEVLSDDPRGAIVLAGGAVVLLLLALALTRATRTLLATLHQRWHPGLFADLVQICDGRDVAFPANPLRAARLGRLAVQTTRRVRGTERNLLGAWLTAHGHRATASRQLASPSPAQRARGVHLYLACTTYGSLAPVVRVLDDPDPRVRHTALEALGGTGREDAVSAIMARLDRDDAFDVPAVVRAVVQAGPASSGPLQAALRTGTDRSRQASAEIVGHLRLADARVDLERLSDSPSPEVRDAADRALEHLGVQR